MEFLLTLTLQALRNILHKGLSLLLLVRMAIWTHVQGKLYPLVQYKTARIHKRISSGTLARVHNQLREAISSREPRLQNKYDAVTKRLREYELEAVAHALAGIRVRLSKSSVVLMERLTDSGLRIWFATVDFVDEHPLTRQLSKLSISLSVELTNIRATSLPARIHFFCQICKRKLRTAQLKVAKLAIGGRVQACIMRIPASRLRLNIPSRHAAWPILVIVVLIGAALKSLHVPQTGQVDSVSATPVVVGNITREIPVAGIVVGREAGVMPMSSGMVVEVYVKRGERVQAGSPLLRLETDTIEQDQASAQLALLIAQAELEQQITPDLDSEIAAQQVAIANAQANLEKLRSGPNLEDIARSEAEVQAAQADVQTAIGELEKARRGPSETELAAASADLIAAIGQQELLQEQYDSLLTCYEYSFNGEELTVCPGLGDAEEGTRYALQAAQAAEVAARAKLNALQVGNDPKIVTLAEAKLELALARLTLAQANHNLLLKGALPSQIAAAEAKLAEENVALIKLLQPSEIGKVTAQMHVEEARINLERIQMELEQAVLRAPFDGIVIAVHVREGELASGVLVEILNDNSFEVVVEIDEAEIDEIVIGQTATVLLESWPDEAIHGQVVGIVPKLANVDEQLATYTVRVALNRTTLPIRKGMTVNARVVIAERYDVLLIPNSALHLDRRSGNYTAIQVVIDGEDPKAVEVPVSVGLRGESYTEITGGLEEGDLVLLDSFTTEVTNLSAKD
jgi:HlyD family secretion protein